MKLFLENEVTVRTQSPASPADVTVSQHLLCLCRVTPSSYRDTLLLVAGTMLVGRLCPHFGACYHCSEGCDPYMVSYETTQMLQSQSCVCFVLRSQVFQTYLQFTRS